MPLKIAAKVDRVDQEYFKTTIEPLLGRGDVEFIGEIREDQKGEFLGNAAALLFPIAWREPFGLVMIESMACGTPVIAFENGSVPEVLEDGVTGFIVHDERQAAAAVRRAIALDRDRIRAEFERRFTARRMAQNYAAVYARLAKAFRRAGAVDGTGKQDKFPAHSLVTCGDAAIPAKRDLAAASAVAPRDAGLGVLQ
jgi:glycosyltransferase involved in cell wall biosynthesis